MKFKAIEDPYVSADKILKSCSKFQVTGKNSLKIIKSVDTENGNCLAFATLDAKINEVQIPLWLLIDVAQTNGFSVKLPKTENDLGFFGKPGEFPYYDISDIKVNLHNEVEILQIIEMLEEKNLVLPRSESGWISNGVFITKLDIIFALCRRYTNLSCARRIIEMT